MARFHPSDLKLVGFARGVIASSEALLISAHCDMCDQCDKKVKLAIEGTAEKVFGHPSLTANIVDNELDSMFDAIVSRPNKESSRVDNAFRHNAAISVNGKGFTLPPSLNRFLSNVGGWSHLVGKLWQAPVSIGGKNLANLIYMEKGGGVPEHTHIGNELTLVLNGTFSDGLNAYGTGDFIALDASHTHMPIATHEDGCLVFSVIDEPLHFTSGWARLINPLSHLYFKASTRN